LAQLDPAVGVGQIHHADLDPIVGRGRAMFEIDLHPQHVTAGWVELELVVITEPVKLRPVGNLTHRREFLVGGTTPRQP
jgi:hypothetical protein